MDLQNLTQFDEPLFYKYFGKYFNDCRENLGLTLDELSEKLVMIDTEKLKLIEQGEYFFSQAEFDCLCADLGLVPDKLLKIGRLTQVNYLLELYSEFDGNHPE